MNRQTHEAQNQKNEMKQTQTNADVNKYAIAQILAKPRFSKGDRHPDILRRTDQLVANGMEPGEAAAAVRDIYPDSDKPDSEFINAANGATKLGHKPWAQSKKSNSFSLDCSRNGSPTLTIPPFKPDMTLDVGELPRVEITFREFLQRTFRPGEKIFIATDAVQEEQNGKWRPAGCGDIYTLERWTMQDADQKEMGLSSDDFEPTYNKEAGVWFAINPLIDENKGRTQDNVSSFRYVMVEHDKIPIADQWRIYKQCRLPIHSVNHSGDGSLHALVEVNAKDFEQFKVRRDAGYKHLEELGFDPSNKDASRLSRLPTVKRGKGEQYVVAFNLGAPSFEEWESEQYCGSTEWFNLDHLRSFDRDNDPNCLIGNRWLCKGGSLILQGYTGIGKSSLVLQMAVSWAIGEDFFGIAPVRPLKTVFVQAENDLGDFAEPFQDICDSLNLTTDEEELLQKNFLPAREASVAGSLNFGQFLRAIVAKHRPDIIFLDPLLSYFGEDISKQKAASEFFRNTLQPIQNETGVILVFVHHLGKPGTKGQQREGPSHYQSLGSSDINNWTREIITLSEVVSGVYSFELGKRSKHTGLVDANGKPTNELYLQHSEKSVVWERSRGIMNTQDLKDASEKKKRGSSLFSVGRLLGGLAPA